MEHKMKKRSYKLTFYNKNYNTQHTHTHTQNPTKNTDSKCRKTKSYFIGSKKKKMYCSSYHKIRLIGLEPIPPVIKT